MRTNPLLHKLSAALEVIAYQANTRMLDQLTQSVNTIRTTIDKDKRSYEKELSNLNRIVKDNTNMNIAIDIVEGNLSAAVYVAPLTRNSPIHDSTVTTMLNTLSPSQIVSKFPTVGSVDLRTGKVGGIFSNTPPTRLSIGMDIVKRPLLTDGEVAAVIMHELGHLFTYFYMISKSYRTNYIMDQLSRKDDMDRSVYVEFVKSINENTGVNINTDVEIDPTDLSVRVVGDMFTEIRRELGTKLIDGQMTEVIADQYATRFGAGTLLVTALDKLGRDESILTKNSQHRSGAEAFVGISLSTAFMALPLSPLTSVAAMQRTIAGGFSGYIKTWLLSPMSYANGLKFTLYGSILTTTYRMLLTDGVGNMTPLERYTRIKNDLINILKDRTLPKDLVTSTLEDIGQINKLIEGLSKLKSLSAIINDGVYGFMTGNANVTKFNERLEKLANNELFRQAATLQLNGDTDVS